MSEEKEKVFRLALKRQQLEVIVEALTLYAAKVESECDGHDFRKLQETKELGFNLKLLLSGEKRTGRHRKILLWNW